MVGRFEQKLAEYDEPAIPGGMPRDRLPGLWGKALATGRAAASGDYQADRTFIHDPVSDRTAAARGIVGTSALILSLGVIHNILLAAVLAYAFFLTLTQPLVRPFEGLTSSFRLNELSTFETPAALALACFVVFIALVSAVFFRYEASTATLWPASALRRVASGCS